MASVHDTVNSAFWSGGRAAWWRGLREELARRRRERDEAATAEERREHEARLEELEREQREARAHDEEWLH